MARTASPATLAATTTAAAVLLALLAPGPTSATKGTYYADTTAGSCGAGAPNGAYLGVAVPDSFAGCSGGVQGCCGLCFSVACDNSVALYGQTNYCKTSTPIIVKVDNSCPTCQSDHIDFPQSVFSLLASGASGELNVKYTKVPCPGDAPLEVLWAKQEAWYNAWGVKNMGGSGQVAKFEIRGAGEAAYTPVPPDPAWRQARWILDGVPKKATPATVRLTGAGAGEVTECTITEAGGKCTNFGPAPVALPSPVPPPVPSPVVLPSPVPVPVPSPASSLKTVSELCYCPSNVQPSPYYSCWDQAKWGRCDEPWMAYAPGVTDCPLEGCCASACWRQVCACPPSPSPAAPAGRKLLQAA